MRRSIYGIATGYLVFSVSMVLLFKITGTDPQIKSSNAFCILTGIYGALFAALGSYLCAAIAGRKETMHAAIVAGLLVLTGMLSLFTAQGDHWSEGLTIFLFAPCAWLGGWIRKRYVLIKH